MSKPKRFTPIGLKLSIIVSTIVFVSILSLAGLFVVKDFRKTIASERERMTSTASAFSAAAEQGVFFRDRRQILEVLRGIRSLPDVTFVGVYATDGTTLAEIGSSLALVGRDGDASQKSMFGFLFANSLTTRVPVVSSGSQIGTLELRANIDSLRSRYFDGLSQLVVIGLAAIILAGLVANMVIGRLTRPLSAMTRELISLGEDPDLTHRFEQGRNDEVGVLAEAFNSAFESIDERDRAIRRHRDTLEETVEIRTSELREAVVEAERANAAKSDFLATMSHEIRTPMNGMLVMAELLAAAPLAEKQRRYAQVISRSGQSLLNIINDILDMSKIEAGRLELEEVPFSLDTLVEDAVSLFAARAHEKGLTLAVHVAPDVAPRFVGDPTRLGQVIGNLTNNALKFTETGGVTISVDALATDTAAGTQKVRVAVKDTGIGIAADKLNTIFEAFSQADQTITRNFGGTGLGLSISRNLVTAMGGEISVESTPGEGASFHFEIDLPVRQPAEQLQPAHGTVLLLDSDSLTRAAGEQALVERGLRVLGADATAGDADAILARPGQLAARPEVAARGLPIVLLRSYGLDGEVAAGVKIAGEIPMPLTRTDIAIFVAAVSTGDYSAFADRRTSSEVAVSRPDFSALSVLAVDDNAVNREVLNEALTALGVRAVFASSGEQAVQQYASRSFDVVFMDCSMPGMDGYQATAELRAIEERDGRPAVHVVALTAHVTGAEAERWRSAGMDGYVAKPFTIDRLSAELARAGAPVAVATPRVEEPEPAKAVSAAPLISPDTLEMFEMVAAANGTDMKAKVFSLFIDGAPEAMGHVLDAVAEDADPEEVAALVHALKSMCSSAGAALAASQCEVLERQAKDGTLPGEAALSALHDAVDQTIVAMYDQIASPSRHHAGA